MLKLITILLAFLIFPSATVVAGAKDYHGDPDVASCCSVAKETNKCSHGKSINGCLCRSVAPQPQDKPLSVAAVQRVSDVQMDVIIKVLSLEELGLSSWNGARVEVLTPLSGGIPRYIVNNVFRI